MAKRNLTKQQKHRIQRIQSERVERAGKRDVKVEDALESGDLGQEQHGLVIAHYGVTLDVESESGHRFRCHKRASLPSLVTGDRVVWRQAVDESGVIVAQIDRDSVLSRPDMRGELKPVAANIDQVIIVVSPAPETPVNLIDRYLVAAHASGIEPVILLNKSDLLDDSHRLSVYLREYQQLGYRTVKTSATESKGLDALNDLMRSRTSIFVGQSGVGKSSLINVLLPEVKTRTAEISDATGKGRHTTTTAVLYHLNCGGQLIDSPGIREFGLWHVSEDQLFYGYPELVNLPGCKFRDCQHTIEPGCQVVLAVKAGEVLERRYQSYVAIRSSLEEVIMRN